MKRIIFLLPFLSLGCASTPPPLPAGATELEGTWQLESVRCEQGENGPMTKAIAKALANGTQEELYVVNGSKMEWHVRERKEGGDRDSYCETVYADTWKLKDGHILGTGPVFRSRVGYLAYRCYEPFDRRVGSPVLDHAYELKGDQLIVHHKNPSYKVAGGPEVHDCANGADLLYVFYRQ